MVDSRAAFGSDACLLLPSPTAVAAPRAAVTGVPGLNPAGLTGAKRPGGGCGEGGDGIVEPVAFSHPPSMHSLAMNTADAQHVDAESAQISVISIELVEFIKPSAAADVDAEVNDS